MTVLEIINIAIISQYKWAVSILKSGLFGGGTPEYLPNLIKSVRQNIEWKYEQEGVSDGTAATSTITIQNVVGVGTGYTFDFDDPDLGNIILGTYAETSGDTTPEILATNIRTALNLNPYGYSFTVVDNVITSYVPLRVASACNGLSINCTITALVVALTTEISPNVNAAPSSGDSVMYILKTDNQTATTQTITNLLSYVRGTHTVNDFFSLDVYFNTSPTLTSATFLSSAAPIDSNLTQYNVAFSQAILSGNAGYFVLVLSVNATPVAGRTGFIDGSVDPVVLTITGTPLQDNQQSNLSGNVTIT